MVSSSSASAVYGQQTFLTTTSGVSLQGVATPTGLAIDSEMRLLVLDTGHGRILIFPPIPPTSNNNTAIDVITGFSSPRGIAFDQKYNSLWVADTGNNRVLRFSFGVNVDNNATDVTVTFSGRTPDVTISPKGKIHFPPSFYRAIKLFFNSISHIININQSSNH